MSNYPLKLFEYDASDNLIYMGMDDKAIEIKICEQVNGGRHHE